jgi:hypothetical protein
MVLMRFEPNEDVNSWLPSSPVRFVIRAMDEAVMVITKDRAQEPWGEYELEVNIIEQNGSMR